MTTRRRKPAAIPGKTVPTPYQTSSSLHRNTFRRRGLACRNGRCKMANLPRWHAYSSTAASKCQHKGAALRMLSPGPYAIPHSYEAECLSNNMRANIVMQF